MFEWLKKLLPAKSENSVPPKPETPVREAKAEVKKVEVPRAAAPARSADAVAPRPVSPAREARMKAQEPATSAPPQAASVEVAPAAVTTSEAAAEQKTEPPSSGYQIRGSKIELRPSKFSEAEAEWQRYRKRVKGQLIMLVAGGPHLQVIEDGATGNPSQVLEQSMGIDGSAFLLARRSSLTAEQLEANVHKIPQPQAVKAASPPLIHFISFMEVNKNRNAPSVDLAVIPCDAPWKVFAWLPFGGWNDVPSDVQLTAVFRRWFEKCGAVPAVVSPDVIEFWLDQPVTDPVLASELAMEMYYLCPDIVDQGTETVENLASSLLNANVWYFWWD